MQRRICQIPFRAGFFRQLHHLTETEKSRLREAVTVMEQEKRRLRQKEIRGWIIGGGAGILTYALLNKFG